MLVLHIVSHLSRGASYRQGHEISQPHTERPGLVYAATNCNVCMESDTCLSEFTAFSLHS